LEKTNISVIIADNNFLSEMALVGRPTRAGFLSTIFFLGYGLGLVAWGFAVDRVGPRRSAMLGVTGWGLTTVWCALAGGINELYIARFGLGLAEGCIWPVCNSYSGRWFPVREHGRIQSVWVNGNQVGIALGLPIVTSLILAGGWRTVFWVLGVASIVLLQPMLMFLAPDEPRRSSFANEAETDYIEKGRPARRENGDAPGRARVTDLLFDSRFWLVTFCHVVTVAMLFGLTTWIPTYITQARGIPFNSLKGWVALSYLVPVSVTLGMGYAADRTMRPDLVGAITGSVVAVMVLLAVAVGSAVLSVVLLVTSLAAPMIYGAMNASIMHHLAPPEQIGRSTGIFVGIANLIGGLAPTIIGAFIGIFGGRYMVPFGFISVINVGLVLSYLLIGRKSL